MLTFEFLDIIQYTELDPERASNFFALNVWNSAGRCILDGARVLKNAQQLVEMREKLLVLKVSHCFFATALPTKTVKRLQPNTVEKTAPPISGNFQQFLAFPSRRDVFCIYRW